MPRRWLLLRVLGPVKADTVPVGCDPFAALHCLAAAAAAAAALPFAIAKFFFVAAIEKNRPDANGKGVDRMRIERMIMSKVLGQTMR